MRYITTHLSCKVLEGLRASDTAILAVRLPVVVETLCHHF